MTLIVLAICLVIGSAVAAFAFKPEWLPEIRQAIRWKSAGRADRSNRRADRAGAEPMRNFTLRNSLIIVGPDVNHATCRLQRRLIKPAVPLLIREDISIIEIYGTNAPRKNGDVLPWLDPALLRHALDAEEGFAVVFVGDDGKTVFRRESPMLTEMIAEKAGLNMLPPTPVDVRAKSEIVRQLQSGTLNAPPPGFVNL